MEKANSTTLFTLPVPKGLKILTIIAIPFAIINLILFFIGGMFRPTVVEQVYMPNSELSDSIFDAQNMKYTEISEFSEVYALDTIPFDINLPNGNKAVVGDGTSIIYSGYTFYFSEGNGKSVAEDKIKNELTNIFSITAKPENTQVELLGADNGFINGCTADYNLYKLTTEDNLVRYIALYRVSVNESVYVTDQDVFIGVVTDIYSSDSLQAITSLAKAVVNTMRFNGKAVND